MTDRRVLSTSIRAAVMGACVAALAASAAPAPAAEPAFPLKASPDGRFLVDQKGQPFFYHADTAWQITKRLTPAEVVEYLDDRKARGFTAIHVQAFSRELSPAANREGQEPFDPPDDILKPVEAYWRNVDGVLRAMEERDLLAALAPLWIRWGGKDRAGWRYQLDEANARPYGRFLGERYRGFQNLVWILGGDANPIERTRAIAEMAAGIRERAPQQLITVHNRPEYSSAAFFGSESWLGINMAYTYGEVYVHVLGEWNRLGTARPMVLGESGYEEESNDGRGGDPARVRRQAYQAVLSGALGGHAFGQKHIWRFDEEWRKALDSPGSRQMAHLKALLGARPWHDLVPDQWDQLLPEGRGAFGDLDYQAAARARDGSFALVYLPRSRPVNVDLSRLKGRVTARWFDPTDGAYRPIDGSPFENKGTRRLPPPEKNAAGDADFVLVLETVPAQ